MLLSIDNILNTVYSIGVSRSPSRLLQRVVGICLRASNCFQSIAQLDSSSFRCLEIRNCVWSVILGRSTRFPGPEIDQSYRSVDYPNDPFFTSACAGPKSQLISLDRNFGSLLPIDDPRL